jgi:hypothetical protein
MLSVASNPHLPLPVCLSARLLVGACAGLLSLTAAVYGRQSPVGQLLAATAACLRRL